jgi:multidrug efflux system membrane fusion protein
MGIGYKSKINNEGDRNMISRHTQIGQASLLVVLACALSGCGSNVPPVVETPPPPVSVSDPVVRDVTVPDEYDGRIGSSEKVDIRARVKGYLTKVNFQAGQMVKKDELLYEIDPRPYKNTLDEAKASEKAADANLQHAKAEYDRTATLVASGGAASRRELEVWSAKQAIAKADVSKAQAAVQQAQLDLDFTKVTAPISGKISRTQVDMGNLVNAGGGETLLTTLVAVNPMYVYFDVDERSLLRYRESRRKEAKSDEPLPPVKDLHIPVLVALEGEQGYPHKGEIDFADNRVNPSTGTIQVRGVLSNKQGIFDDGMRARVGVPISQFGKAVMVTERAVGTDQGRKFVYVVDADNVAHRRDVTPGRVADGLLIIQDGLKSGEKVIVNGIQRVRDGAKVKPEVIAMPGAPSEQTNAGSKS